MAADNGDEEIVKRVATLVQKSKALQEATSALSSRIRIEEQGLSQEAIALGTQIKSLRSHLLSAVEITHQLAQKLEEDLYRAQCMITEGDVAALFPPKYNGFFLQMLLGPVNVRALRDDVRLKVKEEYNSYRDRTAILFLLFPLVLLLLKNLVWKGRIPTLPVQVYQAWLLFFYTSLALRENILRVNGSNICPWWVYHHYCAILMSLVALTWEFNGHFSTEREQGGVTLFLVWAVMQGISMLLQNHYQRQRLYTRIALGKAGRMDVVWGETSGVVGQLLLLYPLLFILQGFQGYIGCRLLRIAYTETDTKWQIYVCGMMLLMMALGNFINTLDTVVAKKKIKTKMRSRHLPKKSS